MSREPAPAETGFTLIEMLVALSVFALAAMALLNVSGETTRAAGTVSARALADIVAENQAVLAMLDPAPLQPGTVTGAESQGGRVWGWSRRVSATEGEALARIDIAVGPAEGAAPIARLTLFRTVR